MYVQVYHWRTCKKAVYRGERGNGGHALRHTTSRGRLDAAKGEKLVKELTMLSQFVREKVVGMAVCIDDYSGIFGSAMIILKCSTPVIIDLGQNDDSLNLPSKITVQAAGVTDPLAEKLEYVSSCLNFTVSPYPSALSETVVTGLKWINSGATRPTEGRDLVAFHQLAKAVKLSGKDKAEFTQEEWDEFGVKDLRSNDYIKCGDSYYVVTGLKWINSGATRPTEGRDLVAFHQLAKALKLSGKDKAEFTQEEWDAFGIKDLRSDDYIKCGDSYYEPAAVVGWMVRHVKEEIPAFVLFSGPRRSRPGPGAGIQILTTVVSPKYFVIDPMITGNLFLLISPSSLPVPRARPSTPPEKGHFMTRGAAVVYNPLLPYYYSL